MAFFLAAVFAVSATAVVGSTIAGAVEGKKQTDEAVRNQSRMTYMSAIVSYGTALSTAPGAVPT